MNLVSQPNRRHTLAIVVNQAWVAWKFRARLMGYLRESGWHVVLLTDTRLGGERLVGCCDELVHVPMTADRVAPWADLVTLATYFRVLCRVRPLVALTFTIKPNIYGSLVCRCLGVPVISNVTGLGSIERSGGVVSAIVRRLYRLAFGGSSWVFFQNAHDAGRMEKRGIAPIGRWSILPGSGVDTQRYRPTGERAQKHGLRFCMMGRLLLDKGVVEYAEAARIVRAQRPELQFELWGITDPSDPRYVSRERIAAWEREGVLVYRGEAEDALQAFTDADVAVLPSYYPEGVPRTLLEAGSMGLPSITTDMPGCRDAVEHDRTGLICAPRDVSALATAMLIMAGRTSGELAAMGQAARRRMVERYDEHIVLSQYRERITAALRGNPGRVPYKAD